MATGSSPAKKKGASRMREFGYKSSQVWMSQKEFALLKQAARDVRMPLATFLRYAGWLLAGGEGKDFIRR